MALIYISEGRLRIDEIIDNLLIQGEDLSVYYDMINAKVESVCNANGVLTADIPVDDITGYVTSSTLSLYATYYGLWIINNGYRGVGMGNNDDVYGGSAEKWETLYKDEEKNITKEVILGDTGTVIINPQNTISQGFFAI